MSDSAHARQVLRMLKIDEAIFLNQLAQDIVDISDGEAWFRALEIDEKRSVLRDLNYLVLQSSPQQSDADEAISSSGLSPKYTPCVVLSKPGLKVQLTRLAQLPDQELSRAFRLLIRLLAIADGRRRAKGNLDLVNHWWHRDLSDPTIVEEIKRAYG